MLANMYVVEPCLFYTHRWGLSLSICRASRGAIMPYGVFERIETPCLHLRAHHHSGKVHKGVYLHACGVAYR